MEQKGHTKKIIFANRKNPLVLNIASNLASKNKEYLELAEDAYANVPEIEADILADFGYAFFKANDYLKATRFFVKALEVTPNNASWLHYLAHSFEKMNDLDSALPHMEKASSLAKNRYLDCLAVVYSNMDRDADAFECYEKALANDPLNAKAWNNIGNIYGRRKDYDRQRECYEKALEIKPDFIWSLKGLANYYWRSKDFKKTIDYSTKVIAIDDKDELRWCLLGRAQFKLGQYNKAKEALEKTIELDQAACIAYEYLGDIYEELDEIKNQVFYYKKAIEVDPVHVAAYLKLGQLYKGLCDFKLAQYYFLKVIEIDSIEDSEYYSFAQDKLIFVNSMVKIETRPLNEEEQNELTGEVLNGLAYELILMKRFGEADELITTGLKKTPDLSYLYATKGMNFLRQGQVQPGHELYLQAISMSPDDVNLLQKYHYEYGRALRIDGQLDEALQVLKSALKSESEYVPHVDIEAEIVKAQEGNNSV
ncbi:MAG: hypothetical protein A2X59_00975 [Nitrospirae bacterium GWC2_42_7]|nr:MAG: hypothetical protein A2X59_00975 [Nitrospirae bacterium GWC2_42_7]